MLLASYGYNSSKHSDDLLEEKEEEDMSFFGNGSIIDGGDTQREVWNYYITWEGCQESFLVSNSSL